LKAKSDCWVIFSGQDQLKEFQDDGIALRAGTTSLAFPFVLADDFVPTKQGGRQVAEEYAFRDPSWTTPEAAMRRCMT
jgi:hypothetical protein